jgi:hypothetical protein
MKKVIRLTETDLVRLVKRVIKENSDSDFSDWLENQKGPDLPARRVAYCVAVKDCLNEKYGNNYDNAPEEFKGLVRVSNCFSTGGGVLRDKVLGAKRNKNNDTATIELLDCLSENRF